MDIRRFFGAAGGSTSSKVKTNEKESSKRKNKEDPKKSGKRKRPDSKDLGSSSGEDEFAGSKKSKKTPKAKKGVIYDSDSDDDLPSSSRSRVKANGKATKVKEKKVIVISDSDEDICVKPKRAPAKATTPKGPSVKPKQKETPKEKLTPTTALDFFGASPVQRSAKKTPTKRGKPTEQEDSPTTFAKKNKEDHDDDDFLQTLKLLDEEDGKKDVKERRQSPRRPSRSSTPSNSQEDKKALASKLAAKVKSAKVLVEDTPVKSSEKPKTPSKAIKTEKSPVKEVKETPVKSQGQSSDSQPTKTSPGSATPGSDPQKKRSMYRAYLQREGPKALGSKEIPEGAENCMEGLTFVITGVLDSLEREQAKEIIERYGGKVTTNVSKKTSYLVTGIDPGESKLSKANQCGTKIINEDDLLALVKTLPGKKSKYEVKEEPEKVAKPAVTKKQSLPADVKPAPSTSKAESPLVQKSTSPAKKPRTDESGESLMWVDKHRPKSVKQIIGQQGEKSNVRKLLKWLTRWHSIHVGNKKPGFMNKEDGSGFKAALLSGPPGVGKTTSAQLVCQEAGFSYVELNASDTRSKKSLKEVVAQSVDNQTVVDFVGGTSQANRGLKHCLVMDEVDGMAGNEDRGGMQELIQVIKASRIPIICMCNDRNSMKVRSLSNYCFDLRFQRPRVEQIKGAMMSLAYKEGIKIPPPALHQMIIAANQDIRQIIHNLNMWSASEKALTYDQVKKDSDKAKKDIKMGPFDVVRKVFCFGEERKQMSIHDKSDLFFHDYSIGPLFVQENYVSVSPVNARGNIKRHLQLLSEAADRISDGDLVEKKIRSQQSWSLLPMQAMFSSVLPGEAMQGSLSFMVSFPSWLGKNSSTGKNDRLLQTLQTHMRLKSSASKSEINQQYIPHLRNFLTRPLVEKEQGGVREVIDLLDEYDLQREDFDGIMEVGHYEGKMDPMSSVNSKVKAAFTRTYNKESHMTPYSIVSAPKKKRGVAMEMDEEGMQEGGEAVNAGNESESDDDVTHDAMIKAKTGGKKSTGTASGKGKGKGPGKGKGKGKKT